MGNTVSFFDNFEKKFRSQLVMQVFLLYFDWNARALLYFDAITKSISFFPNDRTTARLTRSSSSLVIIAFNSNPLWKIKGVDTH
jgi:hypothetical protein